MRTPSKTRAAAHAHPTHIYIVGYSDGIVKVGRTGNLHDRFLTLTSEARRRGATIDRKWAAAHPNPRHAESHLRLVGTGFFRRATGAEYFVADFDTFLATVYRKFADYGQPIGVVEPTFEIGFAA